LDQVVLHSTAKAAATKAFRHIALPQRAALAAGSKEVGGLSLASTVGPLPSPVKLLKKIISRQWNGKRSESVPYNFNFAAARKILYAAGKAVSANEAH
jgi:hypothetical protein